MTDRWKTRGGPVIDYVLKGPQNFEECGVYSVVAAHRDRSRGLTTLTEDRYSRLLAKRDWSVTGQPLSHILEPDSRPQPSNIIEKDYCIRGGLMIRAGIMADGCTDLYVFERSFLTRQRYRDDILAPYDRLFCAAYGPNFIFSDHNAYLYKAQLVDTYRRFEGIERLEWPAICPDFNQSNSYGISLDAQLQLENQLQ
ncbi:transposable element Tcb2 transposase [Trichonephila clavipes]|nr:transposable element Tcb2 transposase [Trichonephila clavipes]